MGVPTAIPQRATTSSCLAMATKRHFNVQSLFNVLGIDDTAAAGDRPGTDTKKVQHAFKSIYLQMIQDHPALYDRLLKSSCLMAELNRYSQELKARQQYWISLPEEGRWGERYRADKRRVLGMEFKGFMDAFVRLPCQIVRAGRRLVYRLLAWNPHLPILFRLCDRLRC